MNIKELFDKSENGSLTYEQFQSLAKEANANFTDLSEGKYVSKGKYDDDVKAKEDVVQKLNKTISSRESDLADLKSKLELAGTDAEKLNTLSTDFANLQTKYDTEIKQYKAQLKKQAQEFAVKDFASTKKFTSEAAKRDFVRALLEKDLKLEEGKLIGADDFATIYATNNADAFVVETKLEPAPQTAPPVFSGETKGESSISKPSLSQMMIAKNENPSLNISF